MMPRDRDRLERDETDDDQRGAETGGERPQAGGGRAAGGGRRGVGLDVHRRHVRVADVDVDRRRGRRAPTAAEIRPIVPSVPSWVTPYSTAATIATTLDPIRSLEPVVNIDQLTSSRTREPDRRRRRRRRSTSTGRGRRRARGRRCDRRGTRNAVTAVNTEPDDHQRQHRAGDRVEHAGVARRRRSASPSRCTRTPGR